MPCCAFAAFIISQVVLGFGAAKRFLLRSGDELDDAPSNPATEWRLNGPSLAAPRSRRFGIRALAIAASIEILLATGAAYGYHLHMHHHHHHDLAGISSARVSVPVR